MSLPLDDSAVQQSRDGRRAPRPLPLFLELVRMVSAREPELAAKALSGLARYEQAPRAKPLPKREPVANVGPARLLDCGGSGPVAVLVPSLINPPEILDLDEDVSLAATVAGMGRRALLIDWGAAAERKGLDLAAHVSELLVPLLRDLDEAPALVGYCLGGTMAIAAANLTAVERVVTIAAPWRFGEYPSAGREALARLWQAARAPAEQLGALPMEVLQGAFWSLDPERTVAKFARFSELAEGSEDAARFVTLEDWANEGEPLPFPAARELIEDFFQRDRPGLGEWRVAGEAMSASIAAPLLHITALHDRIVPAATAADGSRTDIAAGHVGMVVGSSRERLHRILHDFLAAGGRQR